MSHNLQNSAAQLLSRGQVAFGALLVLLTISEVVAFGPLLLLKLLVAFVTAFYAIFVSFKLMVTAAARGAGAHLDRLNSLVLLVEDRLPTYTVLVPLVDEGEGVVTKLVKALQKLDYPTSKLEILLLLEEYDTDTQAAVDSLALPAHFRKLIVPDVGPRTKPKACNWGWQHATGELCVIYDAEDRPELLQLRRAATALDYQVNRDPNLGCVQAQLAFWNPRASRVSTFSWDEYSIHFRKMLPGLARLGLIPPLGGTSNHFRKEALDDVATANPVWTFTREGGTVIAIWGPWDPFNLTEDADLALRLAEAGWNISMLNSVTYEEAPTGLGRSKNQRSRWLLGFAQSFLVHLRRPITKIRKVGLVKWIAYELLTFGTPFSVLINPITWATTILYIVARLIHDMAISTFMESLFPTPIYYVGMLVAVLGNALLFYQKLIVPILEQELAESTPHTVNEHNEHAAFLHTQEYGLGLRLLLTPVWWAFTSVSAYRALRKLLFDRTWDKTPHGYGLKQEAQLEQLTGATPSSPALPHPQGEVENG